MTAAPFPDADTRSTPSLAAFRNVVLAALLAAFGAWLAWSCLSVAMARLRIDSSPNAALRWRPDDAQALAAAAQDQLESAKSAADLEAARSLAQRSLIAGPIETAPLRILGFIAQHQGRTDQAHALVEAAGARSHRDLLTQAWLLDDGFKRGDYASAFERADSLLRSHDEVKAAVYPLMVSRAADPAAVAPLVARLALSPLWRDGFLRALATKGDPGAAFRVLDQLKRTRAPASDKEAGYLVTRLVSDGADQRAYLTWASLLPAAGVARLGDLYDGDFAPAPGAPPFNWALSVDPGVVAETTAPPAGPPTHALHVRFPVSTPSNLATELLLLTPGAYQLSGKVMFDSPVDDGQFRWSIACADEPGQVLAETRQGGAAGPWRTFSTSFRVPSGCTAQQLQLSGLAGEGFDDASAWYADLAIRRLGRDGRTEVAQR